MVGRLSRDIWLVSIFVSGAMLQIKTFPRFCRCYLNSWFLAVPYFSIVNLIQFYFIFKTTSQTAVCITNRVSMYVMQSVMMDKNII